MRDMEIADRRETILNTALKLFSKKGYFNTSVHDIQREANVSIGSIYHHFKNKEDIAKALFTHIENKMVGIISHLVAENTSAHDRCLAIISNLFDMTELDHDAMHYMLYSRHTEFIPEGIPICSSRPFAMMKNVVKQGIEAGEIRNTDINVAATAIFGGPIRLIHLRLDGVLAKPLEEILDECWECSWRAVANE